MKIGFFWKKHNQGRKNLFKVGDIALGTVFYVCLWLIGGGTLWGEEPRVAMIHITDLYRPPQDPDDHFDLACAFALAQQGYMELRGIIIEWPPKHGGGDPDVMAVAQLNRITGLAVPVVVGVSREEAQRGGRHVPGTSASLPEGEKRPEERLTPSEDLEEDSDSGGPLGEFLRRSDRPVVLFSNGSCRDVAYTLRKKPKLFASKVAAVYLVAGVGSPDPAYQEPLEYNVALDPVAYQAMFRLPTPLYWLPGFEGTNTGLMWRVSRHASFYRFRHEEVFSKLTPRVQNYFLWMLESSQKPSLFWERPTWWLECLEKPVEANLLARHGPGWRNMWCTAGQLHATGLTVTQEGRIVPQKEAGPSALVDFKAIHAVSNERGITQWRPREVGETVQAETAPQYILEIRDTQAYQQAMIRALTSLLRTLDSSSAQAPSQR